MTENGRYRADIDGLRAIAVLSVVIYHAESYLLPGGFVGVDIFFVISGYLITGIVIRQLDGGRFSLLNFYERRLRRIAPALIVVTTTSLFVGYVLLQPDDYYDLSKSAIWSIGFLSNVFFWQNTGYFDAARESLPLLHTWSLGVEEQFYLIWPVLLYLAWSILAARGRVITVLSMIVFLSFSGCVLMTESDPQAAFFLPLTRAWELALGGILAVASPVLSRKRKLGRAAAAVSGVLGIALVLGSMRMISNTLSFPGSNALFPVLGSVLLIGAGTIGHNPVSWILSTSPFVWIGKISYSLYLWHWPLLAFFHHYTSGAEREPLESLLLVLLSIVLAVFSWRFVEQPLRNSRSSQSTVFLASGLSAVFVVSLGAVIVLSNGMPDRVPDEARKLADRKEMWTWPCPETKALEGLARKRCVLGVAWDDAENHAVLWGDSHAVHFSPLVDQVARTLGYSVLLYDSCPPYLDNVNVVRKHTQRPDYSHKCGEEYAEFVRFLSERQSINLIMMASAWSLYLKNIHGPDGQTSEDIGLALMEQESARVITKIADPNRRILLLAEVPRNDRDALPCVRQALSGLIRRPCDYDPSYIEYKDVQSILGPANEVLARLAAKLPGVSLIQTTEALCGETVCNRFVNGEFLYRDTHHIRRNLEAATISQLVAVLGLERAFTVTSPLFKGERRNGSE